MVDRILCGCCWCVLLLHQYNRVRSKKEASSIYASTASSVDFVSWLRVARAVQMRSCGERKMEKVKRTESSHDDISKGLSAVRS